MIRGDRVIIMYFDSVEVPRLCDLCLLLCTLSDQIKLKVISIIVTDKNATPLFAGHWTHLHRLYHLHTKMTRGNLFNF